MSDDQLFESQVFFIVGERTKERRVKEGALSGSHNPLSGFLIALSGGNLFWMNRFRECLPICVSLSLSISKYKQLF